MKCMNCKHSFFANGGVHCNAKGFHGYTIEQCDAYEPIKQTK